MALLQVITPLEGRWEYHPLAVCPEMVASVVHIPATDMRGELTCTSNRDECMSAVTFKHPICTHTNAKDYHKPIMNQTVLVSGHFQDISIALGLDESGEIAYERKATVDDDERVLYSISFFTRTVEILEIRQDEHYEWRLIEKNGTVLHQSDIGYGNPGVAVRDGMLVVCDYPDSVRAAEIDKVQKISNGGNKYD